MLTCRELTDLAAEFSDGELPPLRRRLFLAHLARCFDCAAYLDSYRKTILLGRLACSASAAPAGRDRLPEGFVRSVLTAARSSTAHLWHILAAVAASPLLFFYFGAK